MEEPSDVSFLDLMRTWVIGIARWFVWRAINDHSSAIIEQIHECWVDKELALYVRYSYRVRTAAGVEPRLAGVRFHGFDVDRLTRSPLNALREECNEVSAMTQASNLYLVELSGGPTRPAGWGDSLGYPWFGDPPAGGWEQAVTGDRLETILSRTS